MPANLGCPVLGRRRYQILEVPAKVRFVSCQFDGVERAGARRGYRQFPSTHPRGNRARRQICFQSSSFAYEGQTIASFYEGLQLGGVRCPRELVYLDTGFPEQFQKPGVGAGMSLRVVED